MTDNHFAGQKVVELVLDSGETVWVKPLSIPLLYGLMAKSETLYPYPDPKQYEKPLDPAITVEPGQVIPATHNPDYKALCMKADEQRRRWQNIQIVRLCVQVEDQAPLLKRYQPTLVQLAGMVDLPDDTWEAVLLYCVLSSVDDYTRIVLAANGQMVVTEEDVRGAWRIFRPAVSGARPARRGRTKGAPGIEPDDEPETQSADGRVGDRASVAHPAG